MWVSKSMYLKYWTRGTRRQPLRYVCRLRPREGEDDVVFFVILFELVGDSIVPHDESMDSDIETRSEGSSIDHDMGNKINGIPGHM